MEQALLPGQGNRPKQYSNKELDEFLKGGKQWQEEKAK